MKKLTRREKILLYIMAAVVVTAGLVYYAILPQTALRDVLDEGIGAREMELASMESALITRAAVELDIAEAQARIEERRGKFMPAMTSDDVDRYITGLLQQNGLTAESLSITQSGYGQSAESIGAVRVSVAASGELAQFIELMQQVYGIDGIRVSDFSVRFGGYWDIVDAEATAAANAAAQAEYEAAATAAAAQKNKKKKTAPTPPEPIVVTQPIPYYTTAIGFELLLYDETLAAAEQGGKP